MSVYLENLNRSAYQYQLAVRKKFEDICEPLFKLGINYFFYGVALKTGEALQLSNHENFIKDHCFYIRQPGKIFLEAILKFQHNGYFLVPYDKKNQDQVIDLIACNNIWNGFCIFKHKGECVVTYGFGTDTNDLLFSHFYFKNLYLLERFCDYFDENAKDIIDCTDKTKFGFMDLPRRFFEPSQEDMLGKKAQCFLQETFIEKRLLKTQEKDIHLSKRELECLSYLSLGKTMKEIARSLDLSPRSVEFYLQNIKKKSGLNRGELIAHFAYNFRDHSINH